MMARLTSLVILMSCAAASAYIPLLFSISVLSRVARVAKWATLIHHTARHVCVTRTTSATVTIIITYNSCFYATLPALSYRMWPIATNVICSIVFVFVSELGIPVNHANTAKMAESIENSSGV